MPMINRDLEQQGEQLTEQISIIMNIPEYDNNLRIEVMNQTTRPQGEELCKRHFNYIESCNNNKKNQLTTKRYCLFCLLL